MYDWPGERSMIESIGDDVTKHPAAAAAATQAQNIDFAVCVFYFVVTVVSLPTTHTHTHSVSCFAILFYFCLVLALSVNYVYVILPHFDNNFQNQQHRFRLDLVIVNLFILIFCHGCAAAYACVTFVLACGSEYYMHTPHRILT